MNSALARILPYLLLFPAVLPLVYFEGLLYPFLAPKTLLLRADAILALAAFLALALSGQSFYYARLRNPLSWIPGALLIVAYLTSLLGVDFYHSFWSIFDRGDGLITLTCIVGFFYFLLLYADTLFIKRLFKIVAFTGSLVALISSLQWLQYVSGMEFPFIPEESGRIGGTLGNAAFLASYLGLTLFITLVVLPSLRGRWKKVLYVGAGLQLFAILASATRGTLVALLAAGFVSLAYLAWRGEGKYRTNARRGLAALIIVAGLFFTFRSQLASVPLEPVRRLATISLTDTTVESRLFIWQNVTGEAFRHPLGMGAEHITILFNRVYDPTAIVEQWFDRTHNAFLDYLVQYGLLGFLLYLALIFAFAREALKFAHSANPEEVRYGRLLALLAIVYAIQNFFVFDTAMTLWLFIILFATVLVQRDASHMFAIKPLRVPYVAPAVSILIALLVIPVSLTPLRANLLLAEGYKFHIYDVHLAADALQKGYELGTYADMEYGYQLYEMYTGRQFEQLAGEERLIAYRLARDVLKNNYEKYSYDARTAVYFAHVLDSTPPEEAVDEEYLRSVLAHAIELSPKRSQPYYILANIPLKKGDATGGSARVAYYREALALLESYASDMPALAEVRYIIATLYLTIGDRTSAKKWADEALPLYNGDDKVARRAARYYVTVEDWENARRFLADVAASNATDYPVHYDLAKAEFLIGNVERAREIVEFLRREAPGLVETDPAFMRAIGS